MSRYLAVLIVSALLSCSLVTSIYASGEGNIDHGGGGMGSGTTENKWSPGYDGIRITVVRAHDHIPVSVPTDYTNKALPINIFHFGKVSKIAYSNGSTLNPLNDSYHTRLPVLPLPRIISSGNHTTNIEAIKKYFTSEGAIKMVANDTGMNYDTLINGNYKLLLEPIAYFTFQGAFMGMTAHEAALYDQKLSGGLRSKMTSLTHQNLPLALFLETADLGFPAWTGSRSNRVSNDQILTSLGLGIVRFNKAPTTPAPSQTDVEYRTNTDVITSVRLYSSSPITPDAPASVTFYIMGSSYTVSNIVIPEGDSQLVWLKWRTPSQPQQLAIRIHSSAGYLNHSTITASIVELNQNVPPDPQATDRHDTFQLPVIPGYSEKSTASWGIWSAYWQANWVWKSSWYWIYTGPDTGYWIDNGYWKDEGWWAYRWNAYYASLSATQSIRPDVKSPVTHMQQMKSGYGIEMDTRAQLATNAAGPHITGAQTAVSYFPEFDYQTYWRLHDRQIAGNQTSFMLKPNEHSTYQSRVHFTPIWFPDGSYTPITRILDAWTPDGMLTIQLHDSVAISGNLFSDWHIAPLK